MKHEEKVAIATGAIAFMIGAPIAAMIGTPVALGTLAVGTYKLAKGAYDRSKPDIRSKQK
jgi:hypothetical protein